MPMIWYCGALLDTTDLTDPAVVRGYDAAGNCLSEIRYGAGEGYPDVIAADPSGHVYCATADGFGDFFRVYRQAGDRVDFPDLHGVKIRAIALDASRNLYIGGDPAPSDNAILRKYDSAGVLQWSASASAAPVPTAPPDGVLGIVVDGSGNVYTCGGRYNGGGLIRKYNSSGALQWTRRPWGQGKRIALDSSGNIYVAGEWGNGYWITGIASEDDYTRPIIPGVNFTFYESAYAIKHITKWSSSGTFLASVEVPGVGYGGIGVGLDGLSIIADQIYAAGKDYSNYPIVCIYDTDLVSASENSVFLLYDNPSDGFRFGVDADGNIFFVGQRAQSTVGSTTGGSPIKAIWSHIAYDSGYNPIWSDRNGHQGIGTQRDGSPWSALTIDIYGGMTPQQLHDSLDDVPDYLVASMGFIRDWWLVSNVVVVENPEIPALPIPLYFGLPAWIGDTYAHVPGLGLALDLRAPRLQRDYSGAILPAQVFRLYLSGGTGTIELPLSWFTCRRGTGSVSIDASCPGITADQIDEIADRTAGEVIVYRGIRFGDGTEQLDEMVRSAFATLRYSRGAGSASASLAARSDAETADPKTRAMRGISYRQTSDGIRRIRCDIDTYLMPGDTADLGGGETMTVAELVYTVGADQAFMEITEAAA